MVATPERHKEKFQPDKLAKEKTLGSGSKFMPNVGRKRLPQSIRREKDPVARDRLRDTRFFWSKKGFVIIFILAAIGLVSVISQAISSTLNLFR